MRLIDADALPRHKQLEAMGNGQYEEVEIVYGTDIDNASTINGVLSVVRCKDCKYYTFKSIEKKYGWCNEKELLVDETEFCSWGKRWSNEID